LSTSNSSQHDGFKIVIERDERGAYIASCPSMDGCRAKGRTRDEALANLRTVVEEWFQAQQLAGPLFAPSLFPSTAWPGPDAAAPSRWGISAMV